MKLAFQLSIKQEAQLQIL